MSAFSIWHMQQPHRGSERSFRLGILTGWLDLVFPPVCVVCGKPVAIETGLAEWRPLLEERVRRHPDRAYDLLWLGGKPPQPGVSNFLCPHCLAILSFSGWISCPKCGGQVDDESPSPDGCDWCRRERFAFKGVVSLGPYAGPLGKVILRMKHPSGERLAHCMARLFCCERGEKLRELAIDCVVPSPLFARQRRRRRINSPEILAETIAKYLGVSLETTLLRRVRDTRPQRTLKPRERWKNVRDAFSVEVSIHDVWRSKLATFWHHAIIRQGPTADTSHDQDEHAKLTSAVRANRGPYHPRLRDRRVLLVDDVLTTGATCHAAAEALLRAGAREVFVAVLARGQGDDDSVAAAMPLHETEFRPW